MIAEQFADKLKARLNDLGSIDAEIWDKTKCSLHTTTKTHAEAGINCLDKNVSTFLDDFRTKGILDEARKNNLEVLPFGEHTILIFSTE